MKKGWELVPFGDICEISGGSQPPKEEFIYEPREGYVRLIQVRDYKTDNYITYIPKEKAKKFCNATDIMIGRYGPPIFGIFNGIEGAYNVALMKAIPDEKRLFKEYFRWFLKTEKLVRFVELTSKRAAGQDGVRKERLYTYPVPIPPLEEQQTIVAKLDQAFAAIDQAKANIEKNIVNAKELFQSKLNQIFSKNGESLGYDKHKLGNLGIITSSKRIYKSEYVKVGIPFYRTKEIKELANDKEISLELFISEGKYLEIKEKFGVPKIGDILMSAVGTIGEILVIENENRFYFKDGNIVWFKDFNDVNSFYLKYLLRTFVENLKSLAKGAAYSALTIEKIKEYEVYIPNTLEEQQKIVTQLDQLQEQTNLLVTKYQQKLANLEELKKSILEKAFKGEFTNS